MQQKGVRLWPLPVALDLKWTQPWLCFCKKGGWGLNEITSFFSILFNNFTIQNRNWKLFCRYDAEIKGKNLGIGRDQEPNGHSG